MSNETKTNRTQLTDLPVAEQEMTAEEMENVQGGKTYFESRSNTTSVEDPKKPPVPTPLPPAPGKTGGSNPL